MAQTAATLEAVRPFPPEEEMFRLLELTERPSKLPEMGEGEIVIVGCHLTQVMGMSGLELLKGLPTLAQLQKKWDHCGGCRFDACRWYIGTAEQLATLSAGRPSRGKDQAEQAKEEFVTRTVGDFEELLRKFLAEADYRSSFRIDVRLDGMPVPLPLELIALLEIQNGRGTSPPSEPDFPFGGRMRRRGFTPFNFS